MNWTPWHSPFNGAHKVKCISKESMQCDKRGTRDSSLTLTCSGVRWKTFAPLISSSKLFSFKIISNTQTVFHHNIHHLEFCQKCSAVRCVLSLFSVFDTWWNTLSRVVILHQTPDVPKVLSNSQLDIDLILARAWSTFVDTGIAPKSDILIGLCLTHWALKRHLLFGLSLAGGSSFSVW